ncbi:MAG: WecB/TagA/CpsF family glycosyltransferase [Flavobacteriaceae bacterium]|nr:WecB/TagA/CpsF family glycosyltransferase [Flavobacteriaceae bacterium]
MNLKEVIKENVFESDLSRIGLGKPLVINTINPHSYCVAKEDKKFANALLSSDYLMPDGSGIVLAKLILEGKRIQKIAGADIHKFLLQQANVNGWKVFYLGASEKTLGLIKKRALEEYPNILLSYYSPPYKPEFSDSDTAEMIKQVNTFQPDVLFVGMTAPKQEKWVYENREQLNARVITSIGAVFDFFAGTVKRSGKIWINLGLEWLPRLVREPKRLWKRNFVSTPLFLWYLIKAKLNL